MFPTVTFMQPGTNHSWLLIHKSSVHGKEIFCSIAVKGSYHTICTIAYNICTATETIEIRSCCLFKYYGRCLSWRCQGVNKTNLTNSLSLTLLTHIWISPPSGVQSSLYVYMSVSPSFRLVVRVAVGRSFARHIIVRMLCRIWKYSYKSRNIWGGQCIRI